MTDRPELIRRARQLAKVQFSDTLNGLCDGLESDKALIAELVAALVYARRFLKPSEHDTPFVDAILAKVRGETP